MRQNRTKTCEWGVKWTDGPARGAPDVGRAPEMGFALLWEEQHRGSGSLGYLDQFYNIQLLTPFRNFWGIHWISEWDPGFCQCLLTGQVYPIPRFRVVGRMPPYLLSAVSVTPFWLLRIARLGQLLTWPNAPEDKAAWSTPGSVLFPLLPVNSFSYMAAYLLFPFANWIGLTTFGWLIDW